MATIRAARRAGTEPPAQTGGGRPDATNTGYRNAPGYSGSLTSGAAITPQSGQTYAGRSFGAIDIGSAGGPVSGVTFLGCRFAGSAEKLVGLWGSDVAFDYCSFEPSVSAPPVSNAAGYQYGIAADGAYNTHVEGLTFDHCDMWGFANAITLMTSDPAGPVVIRNSWFHDARDALGGVDHTDGPGQIGGSHAMSHVVIENNVIDSLGNTNALAFQYGPYSDFTITGNLFGGFGYGIFLSTVNGPNQRITFTDNTWSTRLPNEFGPTYPANFWTGNGNSWRRNRWSVPPGAAWGSPADDGKFWTPDGPGVTDYTG